MALTFVSTSLKPLLIFVDWSVPLVEPDKLPIAKLVIAACCFYTIGSSRYTYRIFRPYIWYDNHG